jgi:hypothetical protein
MHETQRCASASPAVVDGLQCDLQGIPALLSAGKMFPLLWRNGIHALHVVWSARQSQDITWTTCTSRDPVKTTSFKQAIMIVSSCQVLPR